MFLDDEDDDLEKFLILVDAAESDFALVLLYLAVKNVIKKQD